MQFKVKINLLESYATAGLLIVFIWLKSNFILKIIVAITCLIYQKSYNRILITNFLFMKKLSIPCSFGPQNHSVDFYVGQPKEDKHPIQNQSSWLSSARGGSVPDNVMQSLEKLHDLSRKNRVNFADLCEYAVGTAGDNNAVEQQQDNTKQIAENPVATSPDMQPQSANVETTQADVSAVDDEISKDVDMAIQKSVANKVDEVKASSVESSQVEVENADISAQDNLSNDAAEVNAGVDNKPSKVYDLSSAEPVELNSQPVDQPSNAALESGTSEAVKSKSSSSFNLNKAMSSSSKSSGAAKDAESKLNDDDIDEFLNS